jgi:hypothetical protein
MQLQAGRIQVGTQGTMLAVVLAMIAGYFVGQQFKTSKRSFGSGGALNS